MSANIFQTLHELFPTFLNFSQHFSTLYHISSHSLKFSHILADIRSHFRLNIGWTFLSTLEDISSNSPTFYNIIFPSCVAFNICQHLITFARLILHIPWNFRPTFHDISALQFPTFFNILQTFLDISIPLIHIIKHLTNFYPTFHDISVQHFITM